MREFRPAFAALAAFVVTSMPIAANAAEDEFYRGKQVTVVIGFGPGGSYDLYAHNIARHIGKHLPGNPTVVTVSMPTAGSLNALNYIYNSAAKDGTVFGTVASGAPTVPFFYPEQARFESMKLNWIGSAARAIHLDIVSSKIPVENADDLRKRKVLLGATGPGAAVYDLPMLMNAIAGFKYELILGYRTVAEMDLAMERGEIEGVSGTTWETVRSSPALRDKRIRIVMQYGREKVPELPNVTRAFDLAKNEDERLAMNLFFARQEMGKPYVAPPGLPPERVATLRRAFMDTMNDPEYAADAAKLQHDITPMTGEDVQALVAELVNTPPGIVNRVREILKPK